MKVAVIGTGYVGLVAGTCFADSGNTVYCVDNNSKKIEDLKKGIIPIYEPGLEPLIKRGVSKKRLFFTTSTAEAVKNCEIIFMAVGTPSLPSGEPDLRYLKAAVEEVGKNMTGYRLIVNKSTVPIGTHQAVAQWISTHTQSSFDVVSNPEFLKEGSAVDDFLKPDRVVIGTKSQEAYQKMAHLYSPFVRQGNPILWMDPLSAEITKYACNSFLATRISFINEMAILCEKVGADIESVRKGMITDARIGRHFLYPGVGYGGSCFPKDVQALLSTAKKYDVPMGIVDAAERANDRQKHHLFFQIKKHFGSSNLSGKCFAIWGLAFKPNTDDIREAPALVMIEDLLRANATLRVFDPIAMDAVRSILKDRIPSSKLVFCDSSSDALTGADALVLVTEWNEFRHPDFQKLKEQMKTPVIFDGRNIFDPAEVKQEGFAYYGIGRS